jgi:lipopolysaccharide export system protein LptA
MSSKPLVTVRRLRWGLVAVGVLLVVVLTGFIGRARYLRSRLQFDLQKLKQHLQNDSEGVTFSPSHLGVTLYSIHAARQIRHKDGKLSLFDVGIVLCGSKGLRSDRIHGKQFEYDEKKGVMTAVGEVFIDLAPPAQTTAKTTPARCEVTTPLDESKIIHLKTTDLTYSKNDDVAQTPNLIEFAVHGMHGTAVGASYNSGDGIIDLWSQVHVSGLRGAPGRERPVSLTAAHAEIDLEDGPPGSEAGNTAFLNAPKLVEAGENGTETASALHATLRMSADGTPKHVDADGDVTLTGEGRGTVTSQQAAFDLSPGGQMKTAHLIGTVRFVNDLRARQEYARAEDARIAFDAEGRPVHAVMTGTVEADLIAGGNTRLLAGDKVELVLAGGGKEPVEVKEAVATAIGGARMRLVDATILKDTKGKLINGLYTTNVKGDTLDAHFDTVAKETQLRSVDGTSRTVVERTLFDATANGGPGPMVWKQTGTGDVLKINFGADSKGKSEVKRAEQRGSVKLVREEPQTTKPDASRKGPQMQVEHAEGDVAVYDKDADRMTISGAVKVSDPESALFADRVTFDQISGDATADGNVRVSYLQQGSTDEPLHVLAARAIAHKATNTSEFFAGSGGEAKMWQGGSQVTAPVLDFDRTRKTVFAHGAGEGQAVKTVLVDMDAPKPGMKTRNAPVRILSREMTYTNTTRQVNFDGLVQVNDQDGVMHAREATVDLSPKGAGVTEKNGPIAMGGGVDHIIATGAVTLDEPGRRAAGDRLVYTKADDTYVLTGTKSAPPRIVDQAQGTVTGDSLRFRRGDDSVEVLSGDGVQRVHTETRLKAKD